MITLITFQILQIAVIYIYMRILDLSGFLIHTWVRVDCMVGYKFFNTTNRLEWVLFNELWHTNLKAKKIWTYH